MASTCRSRFKTLTTCSALFLILLCIGFLLTIQQLWLQYQRIGGHMDVYSCESRVSHHNTSSPLEPRWLDIQRSTRQDTFRDLSDTSTDEIVDDAVRQPLVAVDPESLPVGVTSPKSTTYKLIAPLSPRVGDTIHFHIEARNRAGNVKVTGGDFWFGIMESPNLKASTAGRVIDHQNGTYSLYFLAGWSGEVRVRITLVHPFEAVDYLRNSFRHAEKKVIWKGVFTSKGIVERSPCWINHLGNISNTCVYQPKRALHHTQLLCNPPPSLSCETLSGLVGATSYSHQFNRVLSLDKAYLFNKSLVNVQLAYGQSIFIKESVNGMAILDPHIVSPPVCRIDLPRTLFDGFWYNDHWQSLFCQPLMKYSESNIRRCLQGQTIYLTGDSTTRQWFSQIARTLKLGKKEDNEFRNKSFYLSRKDFKSDINLEFIFHPLSLHPSAVFVNLSVVQFEADVLHRLGKTPCQNATVVISPWAHFPNYPWGSYIDWLEGIRDAFLRVRRTCPNVKLIVKTPHPVNMQYEMKGRDWMFFQMKEAMWKVFQGSGAFFVDIWDMNLSYQSVPINMHMPDVVIKEEIALFLSHICRR